MCKCYPVELQEVGALARLAYQTVVCMGGSFSERMAPFEKLEDDSLAWLSSMVELAVDGFDFYTCYDAAHAHMEREYGWQEATPYFLLEPEHQEAYKLFHAVVVAALVVEGVR